MFDEQFERTFDETEAVVHVHRAGDVDHEGQVGIFTVFVWHLIALNANAQHLIAFGLGEGRGCAIDRNAKSLMAWRIGIVLIEVVDVFFHAHRVAGRQIALAQVIAHDGVGTGIHIQGKGGKIVVLGVDRGVDPVILEEHIIGFLV